MLKDHLRNYTKEVYPMHMPGHKGGKHKLFKDLYEVDVTEVPGTDHLYDADGILKDSMDRLAEFYGSKKSIYLVGGSTVGLLSAIGGVLHRGDELLIARNCHQSVYNALTLYDVKPYYIYPKMSQWGLTGGIDPDELSKLLKDNPKIMAFVMTSPTYDGFISHIEKIQMICRRYNVILIVDEAHGAHLPFSDQLPKAASQFGVDIVVQSMHKTLPTFTGSGIMHLNLPEDLEDRVLTQLQRLQTSSPSYIMMAQMDACVELLGSNEDLWKSFLNTIEDVQKQGRKLKKLYMLSDYRSDSEGIVAKDPLKNVIITRGSRINGQEFSRQMREKHQYQLEMASELHGLAIFSVADTRKALNGYMKAVRNIDRKVAKASGDKTIYRIMKTSKMTLTPYEAADRETESLALEDAVNRIASGMITPYPPGIPVVVSGEEITEKIVAQIKDWMDIGIDVLGVTGGRINVIKE